VFLDFTADWCVACKVNERLVLRSQAVQARLRELGVVTMKADWTSYDPVITQALAEFGRHSIPFYVVYGRDPNSPPIPLSEVLSTGRVLSALDKIR
jgi:thiol:disulfide interchange protein DsbD